MAAVPAPARGHQRRVLVGERASEEDMGRIHPAP
jgi:hypothetical protein